MEVMHVKYTISMKVLCQVMIREIKKYLDILTFIQVHKIFLIIDHRGNQIFISEWKQVSSVERNQL
jgi:phosphoribosylformimino-5-aminoimidazole carboxamide ribonucleotide (ProFAR) isomerase